MELIVIGFFIGVISGFFGIGGGAILVPALLLIGHSIKEAVGISVIQMVFSSLFGTYLNHKKGMLELKDLSYIGFGGFFGAIFSSFVLNYLSAKTLEIMFLVFVVLALMRMFYSPKEERQTYRPHKALLFAVGAIIGVFAISIGVGGSILLIPLLVGVFHYSTKKAVAAGLFFVMFSSVAGSISYILNTEVNIFSGVMVGIGSLAGVFYGVKLSHSIQTRLQKRLLLLMYFSIVTYLINKIVFSS